MKFIDVFAGCGGLSLGLLKAGCTGVIAIEKNPMAFETLRHNLIDGERFQFDWPTWLPKESMSCEDFLSKYSSQLKNLEGKIDLMVGGPPCQGFSTAGKRNPADPRNKMAEQYLNIVKIIRPSYIVIENVSGFNSKFNENKKTSDNENEITFKESYADFICGELERIGYLVSRGKINCAEFGVPQNRHRYIIICSLKGSDNLLNDLLADRINFLKDKKLNHLRPNTVHDAIGDLETKNKPLIESTDSDRTGFVEAKYHEPKIKTAYLALMREGCTLPPNSRRLAKHKANTILQFKRIQLASEPGKSLSKSSREKLGIKKHALTVLSKNHAAPTITTLPDDIIHYSELRILTARECARIQSFPDWFEFTGKYTTGGKSRKTDCPRYTQIGNAVPPLLAEAIAKTLIKDALKTPLDEMDIMEKARANT